MRFCFKHWQVFNPYEINIAFASWFCFLILKRESVLISPFENFPSNRIKLRGSKTSRMSFKEIFLNLQRSKGRIAVKQYTNVWPDIFKVRPFSPLFALINANQRLFTSWL